MPFRYKEAEIIYIRLSSVRIPLVALVGFAQELQAPECHLLAMCGRRVMRSKSSVSQSRDSSSKTLLVNSKPNQLNKASTWIQVHWDEDRVLMGGEAPRLD